MISYGILSYFFGVSLGIIGMHGFYLCSSPLCLFSSLCVCVCAFVCVCMCKGVYISKTRIHPKGRDIFHNTCVSSVFLALTFHLFVWSMTALQAWSVLVSPSATGPTPSAWVGRGSGQLWSPLDLPSMAWPLSPGLWPNVYEAGLATPLKARVQFSGAVGPKGPYHSMARLP